jgi:hypothetical protein
MDTASIREHDGNEAYCRKLGHTVGFGYCRRAQGALPCASVVGCWNGRIPVSGFLERHYTPQQLAKAFSPPRPRLATILELVEQARRAV